jgi:hypothetical protein
MKTLAVLMVLMVGCADALPGEDGSDGPVTGAGGGAMGTGGATSGTGGHYAPDAAPDCTFTGDPADTTAVECGTVDQSGNHCLLCTGIDPPPVGGCALRPDANHPGLKRDVLCVASDRCLTDCYYF